MGRDALCAQGGEGAAERKEKQRVAAPLRGPGGDYPPRKKIFVTGVRGNPPGKKILCTHQKEKVMGGGGKGGGSYTPAPTPKAQQTKNVTEAATAAREDQKEKARKAAGIAGSIYTSPLGMNGNNKLGG